MWDVLLLLCHRLTPQHSQLSTSLTSFLFPYSLAVHPDKITIATGQVAGTSSDGKVRLVIQLRYFKPVSFVTINSLIKHYILIIRCASGVCHNKCA